MRQWLGKIWGWLRRPNARYSACTLLVASVGGGIIFLGSFNAFVEYSNTMDFCISCHEMRTTVFEEYKKSTHYRSRTGVQVTCADCHVPKPWVAKMVRKIQATFKELPHKILGTIDTPEKFEAKRRELAKQVWADMIASDSRECRNCHKEENLVPTRDRGKNAHDDMKETGETCIECHYNLVHKEVEWEEEGEEESGEGAEEL